MNNILENLTWDIVSRHFSLSKSLPIIYGFTIVTKKNPPTVKMYLRNKKKKYIKQLESQYSISEFLGKLPLLNSIKTSLLL